MNEKTSLIPKADLQSSSKENNGTSDHPPPPRMTAMMQKRYPAPFYDPISKKLLRDPVVAPGGITYERASWDKLSGDKLVAPAPAYPNRALKQVIEETLVESKDFVQTSFRRSSQLLGLKMQKTVQKSLHHMMEKSILPTDNHKPLSEAYYCPITMELMQEPVIGPEGNSFEREAIELWIDKNQVSPLTRTPLPSKRLLYPNLALREMLRIEANKALGQEDMDASVRDFASALHPNHADDDDNNHHMPKTQSAPQFTYTGPNTLEEWQTLRQQRRQSNVELTLNGLLQFVYFVLLLVFGVVVGLVVGTCALVLATLLDLLVAPCVQCIWPGGCGAGGSDPFGDDELPFLGSSKPMEDETKQDDEWRVGG